MLSCIFTSCSTSLVKVVYFIPFLDFVLPLLLLPPLRRLLLLLLHLFPLGTSSSCVLSSFNSFGMHVKLLVSFRFPPSAARSRRSLFFRAFAFFFHLRVFLREFCSLVFVFHTLSRSFHVFSSSFRRLLWFFTLSARNVCEKRTVKF